ncbi:MAG: hypothetical protein M3Q16_10300 [Pseudomonadota bacterium]|nr:hypothetical protein [Pseudomonadota bacterium]
MDYGTPAAWVLVNVSTGAFCRGLVRSLALREGVRSLGSLKLELTGTTTRGSKRREEIAGDEERLWGVEIAIDDLGIAHSLPLILRQLLLTA